MFEIVPREKVVISTTKTNEEINASLLKIFGECGDGVTKFRSSANNFVIQRTLRLKSLLKVVANGTIIIGTDKNFIRIEMTAIDKDLRPIAKLWYGFNAILFLYIVYSVLVDGLSVFLILVPLVLMFAGYKFTTAALQEAMDGIVKDITKEVK